MKYEIRMFKNQADYDVLRKFLRDTFVMNGYLEKNWSVQRLDYLYWHGWKNCMEILPEQGAQLICDANGTLIGANLMEGFGVVYMQTHPEYISRELLQFMIENAEKALFKSFPDNVRKIVIWCEQTDTLKQDVLFERGYEKKSWNDRCGRIRLSDIEPKPIIPRGFTIRAQGDIEETPARSWASWRAFHPDDPAENYQGWQWYRNIQRSPLYRRDLDIVSVKDDGKIVGFTTVWYDDVLRTAYFEPVGVIPEYHRKGLATAMITEGLRRLKEMEATWAYLGSNEEPAHTVYAKCGFKEALRSNGWLRIL